MKIEQTRQRACWCAQAADENRGRDILVLDLHDLTPLVDFFVLVTGTSRRQLHGVADSIDHVMEERGETRLGIEGYDASRWILLDYGDIVVHVFDQEGRSFYGLEHLWADAPQVAWQESPLPA